MSIFQKPALLFGIAIALISSAGFALTPPSRGEIQRYTADGTLAQRIHNAYALGNHKPSPRLVQNMQRRLYRLQGLSTPAMALPAPPTGWQGGLPTSGNPKVIVILVDFPDAPHTDAQTVADVQSKMFGDGDLKDAPYESLRNFYQRSSYNKLNITGTVLGWYRAQHDRSYYSDLDSNSGKDGTANDTLIKEALNAYDGKHDGYEKHDFSQYDNDGNGTIDALFIKWTGEDNGWAGFWWAYQWQMQDPSYTFDGKKLGHYVWSWYENSAYDGQSSYHARVDIHETGHLLGLPDYYDYDPDLGPDGGIGWLDMMHANWGDHNCFSKFMLDWITPTVVAAGSLNKTLNPSGTSEDAVLIMPNATNTSPFGEFFMAQYRKRNTGNDSSTYPTDGLVIWHVDSQLNTDGNDFQYNNSYTAYKLLRLIQADGLNQIEGSDTSEADAGDFYLPSKTFGPLTTPNSQNNAGADTEVTIDSLTTPRDSMSARFVVGSVAPSCEIAALIASQNTTGNWTTSCVSSERAGSYSNFYTFTLTESKNVTIALTSSMADAYLYLRSGSVTNGSALASNDDSGSSSNSRIQIRLKAGTYTVEATTFLPNQTGAYLLRLTVGAPITNLCLTSTIAVGQSASGAWTSNCVSATRIGNSANFYTFTLSASQNTRISLISPSIDTYLTLRNGTATSGAALAFDDDSDGSSNARITKDLPAGTYTIEATTYYAWQIGAYTLLVQ